MSFPEKWQLKKTHVEKEEWFLGTMDTTYDRKGKVSEYMWERWVNICEQMYVSIKKKKKGTTS